MNTMLEPTTVACGCDDHVDQLIPLNVAVERGVKLAGMLAMIAANDEMVERDQLLEFTPLWGLLRFSKKLIVTQNHHKGFHHGYSVSMHITKGRGQICENHPEQKGQISAGIFSSEIGIHCGQPDIWHRRRASVNGTGF